jgi:hypothetical protein
VALQGTLDTVPLPDVLSLLASTSKVGRLHVEGPDRDGTLWVEQARIIAARCGDRTGAIEVLVALLRLEEGAFRFDPGEAPTGPRLQHPIDDALAEATVWLAEWLAVENVLPSPDHSLRLRAALDAPEVTISAADWRGLAMIGSGGTVRDLLPHFGSTELEAARELGAVVETGLVDVIPPEAGVAWSTWGSASASAAPQDATPAPAPSPSPAAPVFDDTVFEDTVFDDTVPPVAEVVDEVGNGQPWRDQVRQLLGSAADQDPPAPAVEHFGPSASATPPPAPPPPAPAAGDGDRDVLLKFLSSVQP